MATIVNTSPASSAPAQSDTSGATGLVLGILLIAVLAVLFYAYGLPLMRAGMSSTSPNVQMNVPDKINVDVNQGK